MPYVINRYSRWGNGGQAQLDNVLSTFPGVIADGETGAKRNDVLGAVRSLRVIADGETRAKRNDDTVRSPKYKL